MSDTDICPCCGDVKQLVFVPWSNNPGPASGIEVPGVYICQECSDQADQYDELFD